MSEFTCPGSDGIKNPTMEYINCPYCGEENEIFSDEIMIECFACGKKIHKERELSCIDWCKYAKECIGEEKFESIKGGIQ